MFTVIFKVRHFDYHCLKSIFRFSLKRNHIYRISIALYIFSIFTYKKKKLFKVIFKVRHFDYHCLKSILSFRLKRRYLSLRLFLALASEVLETRKLLSVDLISSWRCTCCSAWLVRFEIIIITWSRAPDDNWVRDNLISRWSYKEQNRSFICIINRK